VSAVIGHTLAQPGGVSRDDARRALIAPLFERAMNVRSWASASAESKLAPFTIDSRVLRVAPKVTKVKTGSLVGVGCTVDSCRTCSQSQPYQASRSMPTS
jgi:hypothetical protein